MPEGSDRLWLVTGITSFVGSHTARELIKTGAEVTGVIREKSRNKAKVTGDPRLRQVRIISLDFDSLPEAEDGKEKEFADKCKDVLEKTGRPDVWLHFSWDGAGSDARVNTALQKKNYENAKKAYYLAEAAGVKRFIFAGSQAEYGRGSHDNPEPRSDYGRAKLAFGRWAADLSKRPESEM